MGGDDSHSLRVTARSGDKGFIDFEGKQRRIAYLDAQVEVEPSVVKRASERIESPKSKVEI